MTNTNVLSALAGVLVIAGLVPYAIAIVRGPAKPSKASWIIWGTLDTITFAGMYAKGTVNGQIIGCVIGVWIIIVLALRYGIPSWTRIEKIALAGAAIGIVLWYAFDDATFGIVTSQVVIFLGAIPTFLSAWEDPSRENRTAWTILWLSCVCAVLAIPAWTLADAAQPITFFTIESAMVAVLTLRRRPVINRREA